MSDRKVSNENLGNARQRDIKFKENIWRYTQKMHNQMHINML